MELIDYTNKWLAGEIFEGKSILIAGICLLVLTFIVWRLGSTEYARAILIPMLVIDYFSKERGMIYQQVINSVQIEQVQ